MADWAAQFLNQREFASIGIKVRKDNAQDIHNMLRIDFS